MASNNGKFQLHRRLSAGLLVGLTLALATPAARALPEVPESGYQAYAGAPFFLLGDRSYGSDEVAQVRLEAARDNAAELLSGERGVEMVVYRVPKPLEFLQSQRNLHRVASQAMYVGDGAGQTLNYLYDRWTKESRRSWQRILATPVRKQAVGRHPGLAMGDYPLQPTRFQEASQFKPVPGLELVERFRYPLWAARPIAPPKDLRLAGSSSEFIQANPGNVMVPLGRRQPGLYLVEALLGSHRASTLLFVSDTVAVTKNAGDQMLVWTAERQTGAPVAGATALWTDGVGLLGSGRTDAAGVLALRRASPEKSYVIGADRAGGVFVSENFYYDSEIYNAKLYAVTDRPLYRPGDTVNVKFLGRLFRDARHSEALESATLKLEAIDPNGTPLFRREVKLDGRDGGDTRFTLPANAGAGGWELRFALGDDLYGAAFRVAEYVKPHFDIHLAFDKPNPKSGEAIAGQIRLAYPNGKPVRQGKVSLGVRAQQTTMVEGELRYAGLFPVKLAQEELTTDDQGIARFELPPAAQPSRYVFTLLANDGAAYRVKVTRELLVERGSQPWRLAADGRFGPPGRVAFRLLGEGRLAGASWEVIRLESRARTSGPLKDGAEDLAVAFDQPGSYTINLRDRQGSLLGATNYWVSGPGVKASPGSIEIVADRDRYAPGETAEFLITFPDATADALLTLERDAVAHHALLGQPADWLAGATRLADNQWRVRVPVDEAMAPNMTFSVARVKAGDYQFQNAGLVVAQPSLDIEVKSDKVIYRPGDTVRLDFTSRFRGRPAPALLTVSVVDEMVYVLQPELAPAIGDFFYHTRRNNVRTTASLAFIGYDLARDHLNGSPPPGGRPERGVKVIERPRRDDVDTAAWFPALRTDRQGRASVSFKMPDSLTRWRVTARALDDAGQAGQRTAYVQSEKPLYLKWTGPRRYRDGDEPVIDLVGFNRGEQPMAARLRSRFGSRSAVREVTLKPGPNFFSLPLKTTHRGRIDLQLEAAGQVVDRLTVTVTSDPVAWPSPRQARFRLDKAGALPQLPPDARDLRLALPGSGAEHFVQVAEDLVDYPYGCVEQTASRLIPLALARQAMASPAGSERLTQLLQTQRTRLVVHLAGGDGVFGWWGRAGAESAFLTGYAYYADGFAAQSLGIELPADHARRLLEVYRQRGEQEPILHRALVLWWAQRMKLPVEGLAQGLAERLARQGEGAERPLQDSDSPVFAAPDGRLGRQLAALLLDDLAARGRFKLPARAERLAGEARQALAASEQPFVQALLGLGRARPAGWSAHAILYRVSAEAPTFERAMTLAWLHEALGGFQAPAGGAALQPLGWTPVAGDLGGRQWRWTGGQRPSRVQFARAPAAPVPALLRYTSHAMEEARLPVAVERRLYRLLPRAGGLEFDARPVAADQTLSPGALYVDEVTLTPKPGQRYRYGLLEVPLPPGGAVEATTWGIKIAGLADAKEPAAYEAPEHELGELAYRVPVEALDKPLVVRQLVRFQQRGRFVLPPARYFRMYQPSDKAFENDGRQNTVWRVD